MKIKILLLIGFQFCSINYSLVAQKKVERFYQEIKDLINRVEILKTKIYVDTLFEINAIDSSQILEMFPKEMELIDICNLKKCDINYKILISILPLKYLIKPKKISGKQYVDKCFIPDKRKTFWTDSLERTFIKLSNENKPIYDSLKILEHFVHKSTFHYLDSRQCMLSISKKFVLFNVFECSKFYLILYGLSIEKEPHIITDSEIIFK
jgi:hypothetical protein